MLIEINAFRRQNALPPFTANTLLMKSAQTYAERIDNLDYAHTDYPPKKRHIDKETGTNPAQRGIKAGYPSDTIGEIITYTPKNNSIEQAINNRKDSPSHKAAMLKTSYTEMNL